MLSTVYQVVINNLDFGFFGSVEESSYELADLFIAWKTKKAAADTTTAPLFYCVLYYHKQ